MSLFKQPSELEVSTTIKALIYGQPGLGKSTLGLSTPSPVFLVLRRCKACEWRFSVSDCYR